MNNILSFLKALAIQYIAFTSAIAPLVELLGYVFMIVSCFFAITALMQKASKKHLTNIGIAMMTSIIGASLLYAGKVVPPVSIPVFLFFIIYTIVVYHFVPRRYDKKVALWIEEDDKEYGYVYRIAKNVAEELGLEKMPRIGIITGKALNAFTYGPNNENARVIIHKDLLNVLSDVHLKAVLAHEMGHIKNEDFRVTSLVVWVPQALVFLTILTIIIPIILILAGALVFAATSDNKKPRDKNDPIPTIALGAMYVGGWVLWNMGVWTLALGLFTLPTYFWFLRTREYLADKAVVDVGIPAVVLADVLAIIGETEKSYNEFVPYVHDNFGVKLALNILDHQSKIATVNYNEIYKQTNLIDHYPIISKNISQKYQTIASATPLDAEEKPKEKLKLKLSDDDIVRLIYYENILSEFLSDTVSRTPFNHRKPKNFNIRKDDTVEAYTRGRSLVVNALVQGNIKMKFRDYVDMIFKTHPPATLRALKLFKYELFELGRRRNNLEVVKLY